MQKQQNYRNSSGSEVQRKYQMYPEGEKKRLIANY